MPPPRFKRGRTFQAIQVREQRHLKHELRVELQKEKQALRMEEKVTAASSANAAQ